MDLSHADGTNPRRGSQALAQTLNHREANSIIRSLLMDLRLYLRPSEDPLQFIRMWFTDGRETTIKDRARYRCGSDASLRERTAPILRELLEKIVQKQPDDVYAFAKDFVEQYSSSNTKENKQEQIPVVEWKEQRVNSHLSLRRGLFESTDGFPSTEYEFGILLESLVDDYELQTIRETAKKDDHIVHLSGSKIQTSPFYLVHDCSAHICSWQHVLENEVAEPSMLRHRLASFDEGHQRPPARVDWVECPNTLFPRKKLIESMVSNLFENSVRVELDVLAGGFSSASVFRCRSWSQEDVEEEQSVVKMDEVHELQSEVDRMEVAAPYLGDSAPTVLGYTSSGGCAAVRIQLCGACWTLPRFVKENSTLILTLKSLYKMQFKSNPRTTVSQNNANALDKHNNIGSLAAPRLPPSARHFVMDFEDLLSMVFGEVMAKCYDKTKHKVMVDLVKVYELEKKVQRNIFNNFGMLKNLDLDRLRISGGEFRTPEGILRFFQKFLQQVDGSDEVYFGLQHNDLNGNNVLVDAMGMAWIIDFADFDESHIVRDLAKLETCLLFEYTPLLDELTINHALNFIHNPLPVPGLEPVFVAMTRLRQFAADLTQGVGKQSQHAFALLAYTLDVLRYPDVSNAGKLWALQFCILHAQAILANEGPPPTARYSPSNNDSFAALDLEAVEAKYRTTCRLKHAFYTDAVTCERLPISTRMADAYNAIVSIPETSSSERLDVDFTKIFLLHEEVTDASMCGRLAIIGSSGMGKTLLLSLLVTRLIALTNLVPYVVNAVELAPWVDRLEHSEDSATNNLDIVDAFWEARYGERALRTAMLRRARAQGRLVLLCDGISQAADSWTPLLTTLIRLSRPLLDETESEANSTSDASETSEDDTFAGRTEVSDSVGGESTQLGSFRLVVATRPLNGQIRHMVQHAGFIHIGLQPLQSQHVLAFAENYLRAPPRKEIMDAIFRDYYLCQDALQVSLLLTSVLARFNNKETNENVFSSRKTLAEEKGSTVEEKKELHKEKESKMALRQEAEDSLSTSALFSSLIDHNLAPLRLSGGEHISFKRVLAHIAFYVQLHGIETGFFKIDAVLKAMVDELQFEMGWYMLQENVDVGLLSTTNLARGLNSLLESVHLDAHPLLRCRDRNQRVTEREYTFLSGNAQAFLAANYAASKCTTKQSLQQLVRDLFRQPNFVGQRTTAELSAALERVKRRLVSDKVNEEVTKLDEEVTRRLNNESDENSTERIHALTSALLQKVKVPNNRNNLRQVSALCTKLDSAKDVNLVECNLAFLAFLIENLSAQLRRVFVQEVLSEIARDELLCVAAGSAQFASFVVRLLTDPLVGLSSCTESPSTGWSVLMHCTATGKDPDVLQLLLDRGSDVHFTCERDQGRTALYEASRTGMLDMVRVLVDSGGAEVNQRKSNGYTPLLVACSARRPEIVDFLLSRGADSSVFSEGGASAAYLAAKSGCVDALAAIARSEIKAGRAADIREFLNLHRVRLTIGSRKEDLTLLGAAIKWGKASVTEYLLAQGADPNESIEIDGQTVSPAWLAARMNGVRSLNALSDAGAILNIGDARMGYTPLLVGCFSGRSRVVEFLLRLPGEKIGRENHSDRGESCIELAFRKPFLNVTRVLLQHQSIIEYIDSSMLNQAMLNLSQSPLQMTKGLPILQLLFDVPRLQEIVRGIDNLEACVRNFAAFDNVPVLEFLTSRVPNLCEDARLVKVMLPAILRARNQDFARYVLSSVRPEGTEELYNALCGGLDVTDLMESYLNDHGAASPFMLSGSTSGFGLGSKLKTKKRIVKKKTGKISTRTTANSLCSEASEDQESNDFFA